MSAVGNSLTFQRLPFMQQTLSSNLVRTFDFSKSCAEQNLEEGNIVRKSDLEGPHIL